MYQVEFRFLASFLPSLLISASFTDWNKARMHKSKDGYLKYWAELDNGAHQCKLFAQMDTANAFSQNLHSVELKTLDFNADSTSVIKGIFNPVIGNSIYIVPYSIILNECKIA
jgi:hypothetical protein